MTKTTPQRHRGTDARRRGRTPKPTTTTTTTHCVRWGIARRRGEVWGEVPVVTGNELENTHGTENANVGDEKCIIITMISEEEETTCIIWRRAWIRWDLRVYLSPREGGWCGYNNNNNSDNIIIIWRRRRRRQQWISRVSAAAKPPCYTRKVYVPRRPIYREGELL